MLEAEREGDVLTPDQKFGQLLAAVLEIAPREKCSNPRPKPLVVNEALDR